MTISIHMQTVFKDYDFFKIKMDEIIANYKDIEKCLTGRSTPTEFAKRYFEGSSVICERPKLAPRKQQNLYKIVGLSDLCIFFYNQDNGGSQFTKRTMSNARNSEKEMVVVSDDLKNKLGE